MSQPPSASEKEKTARLVESLSRHEQVDLLAQALLREFMHRRGLRETLRAFDTESPRDARTIASRALMRQLLNIPVEGRPSRLQAAAPSSAGAKPQAPTFMEELCSYRLTKRSYASAEGPLSGRRAAGADGEGEGEEDPSDVELRALRSAAEAQRVAKATAEQRQREYEELLAADEAYQHRKAAHMEKKRGRKAHRKGTRQRQSHNDDGGDSGSSGGDEDFGRTARGTAASALGRRSGASAASGGGDGGGGGQRRASQESSGAAGARWQPPGVGAASVEGASRRLVRRVSDDAVHRAMESDDDDDDDASDGDRGVDPFGLSGAGRQALMARVRAESDHWPTHGRTDGAAAASVGGPADGAGGPHGAAPTSLTSLGGHDAAGLGVPSGARPLARAPAGGLRLGGTYPAPSPFGGALSATVPVGANGGASALRMKAPYIPIPGLGDEDDDTEAPAGRPATRFASTYSSGSATAALAMNSAPSILVKHTDSHQSPPQRAGGRDGPLHSYDRTAVPRSSALAGNSSSSTSSAASPGSSARTAMRSPSPSASAASESALSSSLHTPSRSPAGSVSGAASGGGGGGSSGLRQGIGFRTSTSSAEGPATAAASLPTESSAATSKSTSRKERRVKLLVD
ncbi:hypothetical protein NESM_000863100 [Novymonas esmeraldas]|uniref:MINDY4 N-terminal dimerisation domain-containing protein n=1 Tax=Novymonas esmeraldas TaxID=1808958 RepID=A0AAW0F160_9TRYP